MKQCPKCSRTYANDKQKFCTKDGTGLVDAVDASAGQGETVRIDSAQLDDEITKVISQPLPQMSGGVFDPYKTNVATPQPPPAPSEPATPPPAPAPPAATPAPPPSAPPVTSAPEPAAPAPPPVTVAPPPPEPEPPPPIQPAPEPPPATPPLPVTIAASLPPATPAPLPTTPTAAAAQPAPPVAPKKRSKLPLILGILFVVLILGAGGLAAGYFFVLRPMLEKRAAKLLEPKPEPTPVVVSTPDIVSTKPETPKVEVPPYSPPADAVQFVNSSAKLDGKLAEHYVDFTFYYPRTWQKDPKAGVAGASNFAKVERRLPPDFTQENFAVGWYSSSGSQDGDVALFPTLAQNLSAQFAKSFSDYKKVSEGPTKAGVYDGYEFRFESSSRNTEHGDIRIWGRVIFLSPPDGGSNGVTLLMLTTSLAPELRSVDDVGVRGELPMMLESFRFGK